MKKLVAIILAAVMAIGMATVAFAEEAPALDGSWPEETIKIAVEWYDTTDEQTLAIEDYFSYLEEHFNIEFMYSESIADAEAELAFIDAAAGAGCKGLFGFYNITETEAIKQCAAHDMFFVGAVGGSGAASRDDLDQYDNYIGSYVLVSEMGDEANGDYLAGYELGKNMAEQGYNHIAYCEGGASFGVQMFVDRKEGFLQGLKDGGYDHFEDADLVSGWPGTDEFAAAQTAVISGDYDAVVSSFNVAMWFQPVMESGREIALAAVGEANETYKDFFDMGVVKCLIYDCEETVFGVHIPMLINAIMGYEDMYRTEEGRPLTVPATRWTITAPEQIDAIYDYHDGGNFFVTAEEMAQAMKGLNPDATIDTYAEVFNLSLDDAMAKIQ